MTPVVLPFLRAVSKPTRYTGGEVNEVVKPESDGLLHVALAFPDLYEIGMSYVGFSILYAALNGREDVWAERVFMPWTDMRAQMEARGVPLYGLESKRPLAAFDVVGFTLQFELTYTNILHMLALGGLPWRSADRDARHPLVLAGGPCAVNPEPLAPFVDAFFIGDGEEGFGAILDVVKRTKGRPRPEQLAALAQVQGVYVPSLYRTEVDAASGCEVVAGPAGDAPFPVRRRILWDLDRFPFPARLLVPHHEVVHDRYSVEIARGCAVGCRFCQAGYIYRPARERSPEAVLRAVRVGLAATGFNEVSLLSLNAGEYAGVEDLVRAVAEEGRSQSVGVSLPSLRVPALTRELVASLAGGRKSGFTLAPEAGTQRMRNVVNKQVTEAHVANAASVVYGAGWNLMKLYFMIGLPTETEEEIAGIERLGRLVVDRARAAGCRNPKVNLSTSSFVPKPFTPFQWCAMDRPESLRAKQERLRANLRRPVFYRWHDVDASVVEGVLSLGDRRAARALEAAARLGCQFDGWTEHFRWDLWARALERADLDLEALLHRERPREGRLPWDHIEVGVTKAFLWREREKALAAEPTNKCGMAACYGCGYFAKRCIAGEFEAARRSPGKAIVPAAETAPEAPAARYRLRFAKRGEARFLGHLDLVDVLVRALRRAGVRLVYSRGYHPMPKVELPSPLPLGVEGLEEWLEFEAHGVDGEALLEFLRGSLPAGLEAQALFPVPPGAPGLGALKLQEYEIRPEGMAAGEVEALKARVEEFRAATAWPVRKTSKGTARTVDLKPRVKALAWESGALGVTLETGGFMELVETLAPGAAQENLVLRRVRLTSS